MPCARGEVLTQPDLKKTRWLWLKNDGNLKAKQKEKLQELPHGAE